MTAPTFEECVVAVVGVAKNCGKTTTLNALAASARAAGKRVGLLSIGIDGETRDALLGTPKPPIVVATGDMLATTRQLMAAGQLEVEYIESLGFTTPLGEAVLVRALAPGQAMLGGLRHRADVEACVELMQKHGVEQCWIDGAYGRVSAADPTICDGVVVATGAVVSPRLALVVQKTATLVARLTVPEAAAGWERSLLETAIRDERTLMGGPTIAPISLSAKSALIALRHSRDVWTAEVEGLAVPGLVSDTVALELLRLRRRGVLLVRDGTCMQLDAGIQARLQKRWAIRVARTCPLLAVSYNPTSLQGHVIGGDEFAATLRNRFPNITVFDPIVGLH